MLRRTMQELIDLDQVLDDSLARSEQLKAALEKEKNLQTQCYSLRNNLILQMKMSASEMPTLHVIKR